MFSHIGIIHYAIQLAENSLKIMNESLNVHYGDIMLTAAITSCHNSRPTKPCALGSTALHSSTSYLHQIYSATRGSCKGFV